MIVIYSDNIWFVFVLCFRFDFNRFSMGKIHKDVAYQEHFNLRPYMSETKVWEEQQNEEGFVKGRIMCWVCKLGLSVCYEALLWFSCYTTISLNVCVTDSVSVNQEGRYTI